MYVFADRAGDIEELLHSQFPKEMFVSEKSGETVVLFHNGDRMDIDIQNRTMQFDGLNPTQMSSSRLNMRRHIWLSKGYIFNPEG